MPLSVLIAIGLLAIFLLIRGGRATPQTVEHLPQDGDAATLDELAHAGSDLTREHSIEFYLYLPEQSDAETVAGQLRGEGFTVEVTRAAEDTAWLCLARRKMVPDMAGLRRYRERFTVLAEAHNGEYDGWGTEVEES